MIIPLKLYFIMDNNVKFNIDLQVLGMPQVQQTNTALKAMGTLVSDFSALTSPLAKIVNLLEGVTSKMDTLGTAAKKDMDKVETESKQAADGIKKVGDEAEKAKSKMSLGDKLKSWGDAILSIKTIAQGVASAVQPIFQEGMMRETAAVNFGTLFNDKEKGKQYSDALRNTDAAALYGTSTVNDAAKNMLGFGIDSETTMDTIQRLGDIAMGDAQKLGSLSLAFAQISSAGKLGGQDLMQLINAGFNPLEEISKKTGKSIGVLKDEMAKGAISAADVAEAIKSATDAGGKFNGSLQNVMNNTLQGKMAKLQGMFDDLKAKIFEMVLPIMDKVMPVITDTLIPAIGSILDALSPVFTFLADNIDTVLTFTGVLGGLAAVMAVVNAVMAANPVSIVIMAIAALVAWVVHLVNTWDEWKDSIGGIFWPLQALINIIMTIKDYWASIVDAFQSDGIIGALKRIGVCILDLLLQPVQQLLGWIGELTDWEWAKGAADTISAMRKGMEFDNSQARKKQEDKEKAIAAAAAAGFGTQNSIEAAVNSSSGGAAALSAATDKGKESVASGGTRNTQITINLGNLVENIKFEGGVQENKESLRSQVLEELLRVLYSAQTAV